MRELLARKLLPPQLLLRGYRGDTGIGGAGGTSLRLVLELVAVRCKRVLVHLQQGALLLVCSRYMHDRIYSSSDRAGSGVSASATDS